MPDSYSTEIDFEQRYRWGILTLEAGREIWYPVIGWEGLYEVSNFGRVKSLPRINIRKDGTRNPVKEKILKGTGPNGYSSVGLCNKGRTSRSEYVHALVLETFVGPRPTKMDCCHSDGDPQNNKLNNLRYDTRSGNMQDAIRTGTYYSPLRGLKGSTNHKAKLTEDDVKEIREMFSTGRYTYAALGRLFGVTYYTIGSIIKLSSWTHVL